MIEFPSAWESDVNPTAVRPASPAVGTAFLAIACLAALLVGCRKKAAPGAPPPPEVSVLSVQKQTIPAVYEWVAEAAATDRKSVV